MRIAKFLTVAGLLILTAVLIYFFYFRQRGPEVYVENLIPTDALFVMQLKPGPAELRALKDNPAMQLILNLQSDAEISSYVDELRSMLALNSDMFSLFQKHPIYISAHAGSIGTIDMMYSVQTKSGKKLLTEILDNYLGQNYKSRSLEGIEIREYDLRGRSFALICSGSYFAGSFSPILIEQFARRLSNASNGNKRIFAEGLTDPIQLYMNSSTFNRSARFFLNSESDFSLGTSEYTAVIECSKDLLAITGKILPGNKVAESNMEGKHYDPQNIFKSIPSTAAYITFRSFSSFENELQSKISGDFAHLDANLEPLLARVFLRPGDVNYKKSSYVILNLKEDVKGKLSFFKNAPNELMSATAAHPLYEIAPREAEAVGALLGESNSDFKHAIIVKQQLIIARSIDALSVFADALERDKLEIEPAMNHLEIPEQQWLNFSMTFFKRSENILKANLRSTYYNSISSSHKINDGPAFVFSGRYRSGNDLIKEIRAGGSEHPSEGLNLIHSLALDDLILSNPQCVSDGAQTFYFAQDESFDLHCFNSSGEEKFKLNSKSKILSKIFQVDYFGNGLTQYIFNTATEIYLIDQKGNNVGSYPIGLPDSTRFSLCLANHASLRESKIFLACAGRVYAYDLNGRRSGDFKYLASSNVIIAAPAFFHFANKNYIVFKDESGYAYIMDMHGNLLARSEQRNFSSNDFYSTYYNDDFVLVSTDENGNILLMALDGNISEISNNVFSSAHTFKAQDLDNDGIAEFIFLEGKELSAYTADMLLISFKTFDYELAPWLEVYQSQTGEAEFACMALFNSEIYLVGQDGEMHQGFPLRADKGFDISLSIEMSESVLLTGLGRYLKVYSFN